MRMSKYFPPVFVIGCDRSGTTLLTSLLEAGFNLAAPWETHFIPYFSRVLFLWGDLRKEKNRRRLLMAIYDFLEIWTCKGHPHRSLETVLPVSLLITRPMAEEILKDAQSFSELSRNLFQCYAKLHGKTAWVDNSSFFNVQPQELWSDLFPDLKAIHIIRDGRDVALSWLATWFGPANLADVARRWRNHVEEKRNWGQRHPDNYFEVRYEDLLADTQGTMAAIGRWLNLPLNPESLNLANSMSARVLSSGGEHDLLGKSVQADNKEKWRTKMSLEDQQIFSSLAASTLRSCGYDALPDNDRPALGLKIKINFQLLARFVFLRGLMDKGKSVLPVAVALCRTVGLSLPELLGMKVSQGCPLS